MDELLCFPVKDIKAIAGTHKDISGPVFMQGCDMIMAEGIRIIGVVHKTAELSGAGIETAESVFRTCPYQSVAAAEQGISEIIQDAFVPISAC